MEVYFTVDEESLVKPEMYYSFLESYLETVEGKLMALRPERNVFEFPSRHTYMLHMAIHLNDLSKIKVLLKKYGKKIIAGLEFECRTLNYAISFGNLKIIEYLRLQGTTFYKSSPDKCSLLDSKLSKESLKKIKDDFIFSHHEKEIKIII